MVVGASSGESGVGIAVVAIPVKTLIKANTVVGTLDDDGVLGGCGCG